MLSFAFLGLIMPITISSQLKEKQCLKTELRDYPNSTILSAIELIMSPL